MSTEVFQRSFDDAIGNQSKFLTRLCSKTRAVSYIQFCQQTFCCAWDNEHWSMAWMREVFLPMYGFVQSLNVAVRRLGISINSGLNRFADSKLHEYLQEIVLYVNCVTVVLGSCGIQPWLVEGYFVVIFLLCAKGSLRNAPSAFVWLVSSSSRGMPEHVLLFQARDLQWLGMLNWHCPIHILC